MAVEPTPAGPRTARFARRRAQILDIASEEINVNGARGLTLTAVARVLGLDTSSVTYYFRLKDDLAAACLQRTLDHLHALAQGALEGADASDRIARFIDAVVESYRVQRAPGAAQFANLADMSALEEAARAPLDAAYVEVFGLVRAFVPEEATPHARSRSAIAAHLLLSNALWMAAWVHGYQERDCPRIAARTTDILQHGLGGAAWPVVSAPLEAADGPQDAQTRFLHAATSLINRIGYRGASVERIAAELGVSVGSFYHHLSGKDELVVACFERSFQVMEAAEARALAAGPSAGERLGAFVTLLLAFQFGAESPLLRTAAYQTLPPELREKMLARSRAVTLHIAGLLADGAADGSLRPVDPMIAGQVVLSAIHAASDLRAWAARRPLDEAVRLYAEALREGLAPGRRRDGAPS